MSPATVGAYALFQARQVSNSLAPGDSPGAPGCAAWAPQDLKLEIKQVGQEEAMGAPPLRPGF